MDTVTAFLGELFCYDTKKMIWTDMTNAALGERPSARTLAGFTSTWDKLFIFGGFNEAGLQLTIS
jgi:nucleoside recognition membrane protein YjiH